MAAHAYTRFEFDEAMAEMGRVSLAGRTWIEERRPRHWSRAFFLESLPCSSIKNIFTESFNKWILESRQLPICDMFEWIRTKMVVMMQYR